MTIRKLAAYAPLAMVVAAVVHVAAAGFGHAPGGRYAFDFLGTLVAALGLAFATAFVAGASGIVRFPIARRHERTFAALGLAIAGTALYAALEVVDGHFSAGGIVRGLLAAFPIAAFVLAVAVRAGRYAHSAGSRFAAALRAARAARATLRIPSDRRTPLARRRFGAETRRGRAPPLSA